MDTNSSDITWIGTGCHGSARTLRYVVVDGDGEALQQNWIVVVEDERIKVAGLAKDITIPSDATVIELAGTLMPGMIEGHSHILLHPYNETGWNDQVLVESLTERVVRATVHAKNTLMAGFTTRVEESVLHRKEELYFFFGLSTDITRPFDDF